MPAGSGAQTAHVMVHNLGINHDDDIGCTECYDPTGECVMHFKSTRGTLKRFDVFSAR